MEYVVILRWPFRLHKVVKFIETDLLTLISATGERVHDPIGYIHLLRKIQYFKVTTMEFRLCNLTFIQQILSRRRFN